MPAFDFEAIALSLIVVCIYATLYSPAQRFTAYTHRYGPVLFSTRRFGGTLSLCFSAAFQRRGSPPQKYPPIYIPYRYFLEILGDLWRS